MRRGDAVRAPKTKGDRGVVAVEFALVLPLLCLLLLGTLTAGLAFSRAIGITNAVREGARFGATADIASANWADDVLARTRETQFDDAADADGSSTTVCVQVVGSTAIGPVCSTGGDDPPPAPSFTGAGPTMDPGECAVRVWAARRFEIVTGMAPKFNAVMTRQATARYERVC